MVGLDVLMFLEPFGLLPVVPLPGRLFEARERTSGARTKSAAETLM